MINGFHALIYTKDAEKDRVFFRDVLGFPHVDSGDGWLIFKLPPAELGVHPGEESGGAELYLMCDNAQTTISELRAKGVECAEPDDRGWGVLFTITLPGGGKLGIYEPRHAVAHSL